MKFWKSGVIVAIQPVEYIGLVDMVRSGVSMTTSDLLLTLHAGIKCVYYLHVTGYVHGDLKINNIYVHPQKKGKVRLTNTTSTFVITV